MFTKWIIGSVPLQKSFHRGYNPALRITPCISAMFLDVVCVFPPKVNNIPVLIYFSKVAEESMISGHYTVVVLDQNLRGGGQINSNTPRQLSHYYKLANKHENWLILCANVLWV